jgi:hypothetical protein
MDFRTDLRIAVTDIKEYIDLRLDPIAARLEKINGAVGRHEQEIHENDVILARHEERIAAVQKEGEKKGTVWSSFDTSQKIILLALSIVQALVTFAVAR